MKSAFRNWSDLRVFLAVVRQGSTLAASRLLDMSQPTVARRIDALEHELGLQLFERDTQGFHPTAAARVLVPAAEAMEQAAAGLAETVSALTVVRPIRITAYTGNFSHRVNAIFSEFALLRPDIRFEFLRSVRVLDLLGGEADIALRLTRAVPEPSLICRKISTAQFSLFGSRAYAARHGLPSSPDDLAGHRFVRYDNPDVSPLYTNWIVNRVAPAQIVLTFSEMELVHAAIRAGQALGMMNLRLAETDGDLVRCFDPIPELAAEHLLLVAPEAYRRPEVRSFVKFFAPRYAAVFR